MSATPSPIPPDLDQAGHGLRQVLLRLNHYAKNQAQRVNPNTSYGAATLAHVGDLQALLKKDDIIKVGHRGSSGRC